MKVTYVLLILIFPITSVIVAQDNGCVFTSDTKPIAVDLISQFQNIEQWQWSESDSTIVAQTKTSDSIVLQVSGCIHMSYNFKLHTSSAFSDWSSIRSKLLNYFTQKVNNDVYQILTKATQDNIDTMRSNRKIFMSLNSYPVQDIAGNLVVLPFVIESDTNSTSININWYYN